MSHMGTEGVVTSWSTRSTLGICWPVRAGITLKNI